MKSPFWEKYLEGKPLTFEKCLPVSLIATLGAGLLASVASGNMRGSYENMKTPPLSPPGWVFPVVWTVLYVLMAVAFCLMLTGGKMGDGRMLGGEGKPDGAVPPGSGGSLDASGAGKRAAVRLYELQLLLNISWPIVFFNLGLCWLALVVVVLLWLTVFQMIKEFRVLNRLSGLLLVPYLAWITFAVYLNLGSCILN